MRTGVEADQTRYLRRVLQIVDCIYAAACGDVSWELTLAEVCQAGRLCGCALSMLDRLERRRVVVASYGLSLAAERKAKLGLIPGNLQLTERVLRSTVGAIWQDRQIMSEARSSTTSSRTDLTTSNGLISWACVVVGRDERRVVCLEAFAGAGGVSSCPKLDGFLHQLAPHLIRAWRLVRTSRSTLATFESGASRSDFRADAAPAPDYASLPGVARLRAEFGLTKAEARLALRIAEGSSLASAAQAFNVKLTTIRSQLQQVFAKTGASRQTELVAMILSRGYGARDPLWCPVGRERQAATLAEPGS